MQVNHEDKEQNHRNLLAEVLMELRHDINVAEMTIQGSQEILERIKDRPEDETILRMRTKYQESIILGQKQKQRLLDLMMAVKDDRLPQYSPTELDLVRIVDDTVKTCVGMLDNEGIHLIADYMAEPKIPIKFCGEKVRAKTVFMNLFSNMRRALGMTPSPQIRIGVYDLRDGETPYNIGRVVMSNNGPRLPSDDLEEVFKPYVSGSGSKGIGLTICRDIIEDRFGGKIYAVHPAKGGVAFYIELPLIGSGSTSESK